MCTLILLRRPGHSWPLLLGANRDEMQARPWRAPARHWPDKPTVVAGLDELAGGSWLGLNDSGVIAAVLNRPGSLGPASDKRSRGELVLDALNYPSAAEAASALAARPGSHYRSFNLVIADAGEAYWLRHDGSETIGSAAIEAGLSMFTAHDRNAATSPRVRTYLPLFEVAEPPEPELGRWQAWSALLGRRDHGPNDGPEGAMVVDSDFGFGTVNASLLALPAAGTPKTRPFWFFADGPPDRVSFMPVAL